MKRALELCRRLCGEHAEREALLEELLLEAFGDPNGATRMRQQAEQRSGSGLQ